MNLKAQAHCKPIFEDPFCQQLRGKQAMRGIARSLRELAKGGRKDNTRYPIIQAVLAGKAAGKLVVGAVAQHKLHLVVGKERLQIAQAKSLSFAGVRALY